MFSQGHLSCVMKKGNLYTCDDAELSEVITTPYAVSLTATPHGVRPMAFNRINTTLTSVSDSQYRVLSIIYY